MPTRDNLSNQRTVLRFNENITTNTNTVPSAAAILDSADYDMGIFFSAGIVEFTDGSYTVEVQESDESNMANANVVAAENMIGDFPILTALTGDGDQFQEVGMVGTKRYLRIRVVSTGVTTGARVVVSSVEKGEYNPQDRV